MRVPTPVGSRGWSPGTFAVHEFSLELWKWLEILPVYILGVRRGGGDPTGSNARKPPALQPRSPRVTFRTTPWPRGKSWRISRTVGVGPFCFSAKPLVSNLQSSSLEVDGERFSEEARPSDRVNIVGVPQTTYGDRISITPAPAYQFPRQN